MSVSVRTWFSREQSLASLTQVYLRGRLQSPRTDGFVRSIFNEGLDASTEFSVLGEFLGKQGRKIKEKVKRQKDFKESKLH